MNTRVKASLYIFGAIAALFCLSYFGAAVAIIASLFLISLPIAFVIYCFPTVYLVFLLSLIIKLVGGIARIKIWLPVRLALALAILTILPLSINRQFAAEDKKYVVSDFDALSKPFKFHTFAILSVVNYGRKATQCNEFCLRALLAGSAKKIIMADTKFPYDFSLNNNIKGEAYWFEKGNTCTPQFAGTRAGTFPTGQPDINLANHTPEEIVHLLAVKGICLVSKEMPLSTADGVLIEGLVKQGSTPFGLGFSLFENPARVYRLSFFQKNNGKLQKTFEQTNISTSQLFPILIPTSNHGSNFAVRPGFKWDQKSYGSEISYQDFILKTLGMNLAINGTSFEKELIGQLEKIAKTTAPLDENQKLLVQNFFSNSNWYENKITPEQLQIAKKIFENPIIELPDYANRFVEENTKTKVVDNGELAAQLFARLKANTQKPILEPYGERNDQLKKISLAIYALPPGTVKPYFDILATLAEDPVFRIFVYKALERLGDDSTRGPDKLLYLIADSKNYLKKEKIPGFTYIDVWQHPYLSGVLGLCRMGAQGYKNVEVVNKLLELVKQGVVNTNNSLTTSLLINLGATREQIIDAYEAFGETSKYKFTINIRQIDKAFKRYEKEKKLGCSY